MTLAIARAVVTGSSGFVGGHLVRALLEDGTDVTGLSHKPPLVPLPEDAREQLADVRDGDAVDRILAEAKPDVVFHLAAQASVPVSMRDPVADIETNVIGSVRVAQAAAAAGARRLVFFSTGGALFGQPEVLPAHEDTPLAPQSIYGASKISAEHELGALCNHLGIELCVVRPGNIYGPGQDSEGESGVVAIFATRMLLNKPATIFGDGSQRRDYVFVGDVVDAARRAAVGSLGTCVLGTGHGTTTLELFETLASVIGYDPAPVFEPERPGDIAAIVLDSTRARTLWGWEPRVGLRKGLTETVDWFRGQLAQA